MSLSDSVRQFEKEMIGEVLLVTHGNKTKTAELLGISRRSLFNKMRDYDLLKDNETEIN
jgi:DNA-binding NtrC family response regulator